jgi:hypothetical protein
VPPLAKTDLGLGMKFIHSPPYTHGNTSTTIMCLEHDVNFKVFFAHHPTNNSKPTPKLYVKFLWSPLPTEIPPWVDDRLNKFTDQAKTLFQHHKATPNLLPYQDTTLQNLCTKPKILFPDTVKGLGPCAVRYEQYVTDALIHLSDTSMFKHLMETEAWIP